MISNNNRLDKKIDKTNDVLKEDLKQTKPQIETNFFQH